MCQSSWNFQMIPTQSIKNHRGDVPSSRAPPSDYRSENPLRHHVTASNSKTFLPFRCDLVRSLVCTHLLRVYVHQTVNNSSCVRLTCPGAARRWAPRWRRPATSGPTPRAPGRARGPAGEPSIDGDARRRHRYYLCARVECKAAHPRAINIKLSKLPEGRCCRGRRCCFRSRTRVISVDVDGW